MFVTTVPPAPPASVTVTDTTAADFNNGTVDAGAYVGDASGGETMLLPAFHEEFSGAVPPADWTSVPWAVGGATSFAGGQAAVNGALLTSDGLLSPGQSLEFVATFSPGAGQHGGFALDFDQTRWAIFSTQNGGALFARTHDGITPIDTLLPGSWLGSPHRFRIEWASALVTFYIDGTLVASHTQSISGPMRPAFSDFSPGGDVLLVSSVRMVPYATAGTFTSRILDAGSPTVWTSASSVTTTPTGTTLALSVRFGNTPTPDGTWTSFGSVALGNGALSGTSRYAQYRTVMTGTGDLTPELASITLSGTAVAPLPTVSVTGGSVVEGSSGVSYQVFTVALSAPTYNQVSVSYATSDGSAQAGSDYDAVSGTVVFAAGSTTRTVVVPVVGDTSVEADETFGLTLSAPVNATLGQACRDRNDSR